MEKEQIERVVVSNGTPDLSLMPSDVLNMIASALEINLAKAINEVE